jgi:hypothetical protein
MYKKIATFDQKMKKKILAVFFSSSCHKNPGSGFRTGSASESGFM